MDGKEFITKAKLLFSTLFTRKMPYVICDYTGNDILPHSFVFTDISPSKLIGQCWQLQDFSYNFAHIVSINDKEFMDQFGKMFSNLYTHTTIVNMSAFVSLLDKIRTTPDMLREENWPITNYYPKGPESSIDYGADELLISEYETIVSHGMIELEPMFCNEKRLDVAELFNNLNQTDIINSAISHVAVIHADTYGTDGQKLIATIPLFESKSLPSVDFIKKAKLSSYTCKLIYTTHLNTVRANVVFESDFITVRSMQPCMSWYAKPVKGDNA